MESAFENPGMQRFLVIPGRPGRSGGVGGGVILAEGHQKPELWYQTPGSRTRKEQNFAVPIYLARRRKTQSIRICTQAGLPPYSLPLTAGLRTACKAAHLCFKERNPCTEQSWKTMQQRASFWVVRSQMEFHYLLLFLICVFSLQHWRAIL